MAKPDPTPSVDSTPEAAAEEQVVEPTLPFNPKDVPGSAETILYTRPGYTFQSNVEGVDTITEHGLRVNKTQVDAIVESAAPFGEGFLSVYNDKG